MGGFLFLDQGEDGQQLNLVTGDKVPVNVRIQASSGSVDASAVTYTPGTPTDWPSPLPANVAAALDVLASVRGFGFSNPTRVPLAGDAQTNTVGPFVVLPEKSGVYLAFASAELDSSNGSNAANVARLTIRADGSAVGAAIGTGYAQGRWTLTVSTIALVVLNRLVSHSWDLLLDTGDPLAPAHIDVDQAKLVLVEL